MSASTNRKRNCGLFTDYEATDYNPHFNAVYVSGACMKSVNFRLDRRIFELFQDDEVLHFTICELRDAYVRNLEDSQIQLSGAWRYIHDQIQRLIRVGWICEDGQRKGRGKIYRVLQKPSHLTLQLIERNGSRQTPLLGPPQKMAPTEASKTSKASDRLDTLAKETRLDLLTSMGEAERYKQLLDEFPHLKDKIEGDYHEARDRSSRLLGHLRAIEKTLNSVLSR